MKSRFNLRRRRALSDEELAALHAERHQAVSQVPPECWAPTSQIREIFDSARARIAAAVIDRSRTDRHAAVQVLRQELRQAANEGQWRPGSEGHHVVEHGGRVWSISADGRGVLSCDPPWPMSRSESGQEEGVTDQFGDHSGQQAALPAQSLVVSELARQELANQVDR